jgi:hypothetical protein
MANTTPDKTTSDCTPIKNEPKSNIKIKCKHRACPVSANLKVFELVPENKYPYLEELEVQWTGSAPPPPPTIKAKYRGYETDPKNTKEVAGPPYKIPIPIHADRKLLPLQFPPEDTSKFEAKLNEYVHSGLNKLFQHFDTFNLKSEIELQDLSFGTKKVIVYNPDDWELKITLPQTVKLNNKLGYKWDKQLGKDGKLIETLELEGIKNKQTQKISATAERAKNSYELLKPIGVKDEKTDLSKIKFELTRSGNKIFINAFAYLQFIFEIVKWAEAFAKAVNDIPKAGVYFEFGLKACEGSITFKWGWKENLNNHLAYYNVGLAFDFTIFEGSMELGIGVSGFSIKLQIFAKGEVSLKINFEANRVPDNSNTFTISDQGLTRTTPATFTLANLSANLNIGARAEALCLAKAEAKITSGIEVKLNGSLGGANPVTLTGNASWTGIKGTVECSIGVFGSGGTETSNTGTGSFHKAQKVYDTVNGMEKSSPNEVVTKTFFEPCLLGSFTYPDSLKPYSKSNNEVPSYKFREAIIEMLNGKYKNSGFFNDFKIVIGEWDNEQGLEWYNFINVINVGMRNKALIKEMDQSEIANMIIEKIDSICPNFDKRAKSIELFLVALRGDLISIFQTEYSNKHLILSGDFQGFINGSKFKNLCFNNINIEKKIYNDNKAAFDKLA